jgi:hypothetical protein
MAGGGMSEKPLELLDLLKKARDPREIIATADEIGRTYESSPSPKPRKNYFPKHREPKRRPAPDSEQQLAKDLCHAGQLILPDNRLLRILYYQCPLKRTSNDKRVGKIDLIGCVENSLALIELKAANSKENPRVALLELVTYEAIVRHNRCAFDEQFEKRFNTKLGEEMQLIILARQPYWDRWIKEDRRKEHWKKFCDLCQALRHGPHTFHIQCLTLDQDFRSVSFLRSSSQPTPN